MIQRIQSVWLLLAAICALFTFRFPFYSGNVVGKDNLQHFEKLVASSDFLLLILTVLLIAGAIIIIFLYKNRKQQMWLTISGLVLSGLNIFIYFKETKKFVSGNMSLTSILSLAIPVFFLLALNGISKDEKLVKSLDRLR